MITERDKQAIRDHVDRVEDPEVPITLTDLGVVREIQFGDDEVVVTLRPTRLACPAREEMARRVRLAVAEAASVKDVEIRWEMAAWRGADVSAAGTKVLLDIGYAHPHRLACRAPSAVPTTCELRAITEGAYARSHTHAARAEAGLTS